MQKSSKGEVVLSAFQANAARLNKIEQRRLTREITFMNKDLHQQLAKIRRQAQTMLSHYQDVVRYVKPSKTQHWRINNEWQDKPWFNSRSMPNFNNKQLSEIFPTQPSEQQRPLLILLDQLKPKDEPPPIKPTEFLWNRPRTTPTLNRQHTAGNPLLSMLSQAATGTTKNQLQQSVSTSLPTPKMVHGTLVMQQGIQNLDAAYRMALQNQTAYSTVDPKIIAERKLMDKDFAGQYRALVGYRSACISKSALKSAKSTS